MHLVSRLTIVAVLCWLISIGSALVAARTYLLPVSVSLAFAVAYLAIVVVSWRRTSTRFGKIVLVVPSIVLALVTLDTIDRFVRLISSSSNVAYPRSQSQKIDPTILLLSVFMISGCRSIHDGGQRSAPLRPADSAVRPTQARSGAAMDRTSGRASPLRDSGPDADSVEVVRLSKAARLEALPAESIVPVRPGALLAGIRVFGIKPGSAAEALGLRNGDTIRRVNGVSISDSASNPGLGQELFSVPLTQIDLLRHGARRTIRYETPPSPTRRQRPP